MKYPAVIENMSFEEYEAQEGINSSLLKIVHQKSLAHAYAYKNGKRTHGPALDFGHAFHSLVLEDKEEFVEKPETYNSIDKKTGEIEVKKWSGNATICKEWEENTKASGKLVLGRWDAYALREMNKILKNDPRIDFEGKKEVSVFVEKGGIIRKCRIDLLPDNPASGVVDIKTTESAKPKNFIYSAIGYGYDLQFSFYLDCLRLAGIDRDHFLCVAVEKNHPFAHTPIKFEDDEFKILGQGRIKYRKAMRALVTAMKTNEWPSYPACNADDSEICPETLKYEITN